MRLVDLNPEWWAEPGRYGQGVTFDCPHCHAMRIIVVFSRPRDGHPPADTEMPRYDQHGTNLEDLTITPRIHVRGHGGILVSYGDVSTAPRSAP